MLFGVERDVVVIELGQSLSVALPVEQARERLRPLASQTDLRRVEQTLAGTRGVGEGNWRQRLRVGQAKLAGGELVDLAEIVRDGMRAGSGRAGARLSVSEQKLYLQARQLVAQEIAAAGGLEEADADAWIDAHAHPDVVGPE